MSSLLRPVGSAPPGVYWFRRALVLLVVLALLLGVRWMLSGRGGSTPTAGGSPSPSSSPSADPSPTTRTTSPPATSPTPTSSPTASATSSPTASATSTVPTCTDKAITVTASTDAASYPVGSTPRLRMRIQNTSSAACRRDVGAAQNELVITSGSARVWSSDDCSPGGSPEVVTLQPTESYSVSVTWQGRLSSKGCPTDQPIAGKGTYRLTGRNGAVTSAAAIFSLT